MSVLVIAEHDNRAFDAATLCTITAAKPLGEVAVLIAGENGNAVAEAAANIEGVARVLVVDDARYAHFLAEPLAALIAEHAKDFTHVLAPASTFGKNVLPRAAALCDCAQVSSVIRIVDGETFVRPVYAGNALATVHCADPIKFLTILPIAFAPAACKGGAASVEMLTPAADPSLSRFVGRDVTQSGRPDLSSAKIVVSGGRGMQSAENFKLLEKLADLLGAGIGASRAAVDAGFVPNDYQVGQTGKTVAPDLYIAVGISGAIQHLAGMKDSKVIVAINKDPDAPILQIADYGLVADLFTALPALCAEVEKIENKKKQDTAAN